jgi:hypothetical protein
VIGANLFEEQGGLFGHLVSRFSTSPENLATEALAFIVNRSATMREELRNLFGRTVMDTDAFLPVRVEELTNLEVPRRLIGLADLIRDLSEQAAAIGIADSKGLLPTHRWYAAGRYLRIGQVVAWLGIDHENWSRYGISPLWVIFHQNIEGPLVLEALKSWAPPRLFEQDGRAMIPLTVLPNVTREIVLEDLLKQLEQLYDGLPSAAAAAITTTQV